MSSDRESLATRLKRYAETHRGTQAFTADHVAVRAAKRYRARTGASWNIGVGGRCELGKRAIKQWLHELSAPLRHVLHFTAARWVMVLLVVLAVVGIGLLSAPATTLGILQGLGLAVATVVVIVVGFSAGILTAGNHVDHLEMFTKRDRRILVIVGWVIGLPVAVVVYLIARLVKSRYFSNVMSVVSWLIVGAGVLSVVVLLGYLLVSIFTVVPLWTLVEVVAAVAVIVGVSRLWRWYKSAREARQRVARREHGLSFDSEAYKTLRPVLEACYQRESLYGTIVFESWVRELRDRLGSRNLIWSDLLTDKLPSSTFKFLMWRNDANDLVVEDYRQFILDVKELRYQLELAHYGRRLATRTRQGVSFIVATIFLLKSRVCPGVVLPKWDEVDTDAK